MIYLESTFRFKVRRNQAICTTDALKAGWYTLNAESPNLSRAISGTYHDVR